MSYPHFLCIFQIVLVIGFPSLCPKCVGLSLAISYCDLSVPITALKFPIIILLSWPGDFCKVIVLQCKNPLLSSCC